MFKLFLVLIFILSGCSTSPVITSSNTPVSEDSKNTDENTPQSDEFHIDYDLTKMSSTMVYSQVYNMVYNHQDYVGDTMRFVGVLEIHYNTREDKELYYVVINDATGCCPQGLQVFFPEGTQIPENLSLVLVDGTFTVKDAGEYSFYCVDAHSITVVSDNDYNNSLGSHLDS